MTLLADRPNAEPERCPGCGGMIYRDDLANAVDCLGATETKTISSHVIVAWLGHSEIIALKHDRQISDAVFERAAAYV